MLTLWWGEVVCELNTKLSPWTRPILTALSDDIILCLVGIRLIKQSLPNYNWPSTTITNWEVQNPTKHFVALQQCNVGSHNFSSRKSKSLEFHSNFLEGGSQTNPSTGRMPVKQVKSCGSAKCVTIVTLTLAQPIRPFCTQSL